MAGDSSEAAARLVVVTGAGGFIGRALVAHLRETGRPVRAVVRRPAEQAALHATVHAVADLAEAMDAEPDAVVRGTAAVVHLAGRAHVTHETASDPAAAYTRANAVVTSRLARAALRAGVARFVIASTVKVNGETSAPSRPFRP